MKSFDLGIRGKVSIVVPCYQKEKYLSDTLDSVLAQTYQNWECIIVVDGSPDKCFSIANEYCKRDARFYAIKQANSGVSAARNTGILHSRGEFILPLDADDLIAPTYLEKTIDCFKRKPDVKLVYCIARCIVGNDKQYALPPYDYKSFLKRSLIYCTALYRRRDYDLTKGYNPNMKYGLEDWDFWLSLLNEDDNVCRIDEELFFYRIMPNTRTANTISHLSEMEIQIFNNHPDKYLQVASNWIVLNRQIRDLSDELTAVKEELIRTRKSFAFRLGKIIVRPFGFIRHIKG